jgi:hypothetical protein
LQTATKNITDTSCGVPTRSLGETYDAISIAMAVISSSLVLGRVAFKLFVTHSLSADDYVILLLAVVGAPSVIITHYGTTPNGLGRDIWTLSPQKITDFLFYFFIMAILYFTQVMLVKLCLLLFYLRIFPSRGVRLLLWGTIIFTLLFGVIFVFVAIFQCSPISFFWTHWDGEHEGSCLNINAIAWANAAISIALDFWMLAIPLAQLRGLNLHWKKKIGVALMFVVGTLYVVPFSLLFLADLVLTFGRSASSSVTVMSIIRLQALVTFAKSSNPTWDNFPVSLWSTVEINVGMVCTCMPTLRLMLVRVFPALGAGSSYGRGYYPSGGGQALSSGGRASRKRTQDDLTISSKIGNSHPGSSGGSAAAKPAGILRQQTFAVKYDDDEASLVQLGHLDRRGRSDASAASSTN